MRNRTFPKENQKKLNQIIKDLKDLVRQRDKEIRFLREEIENIMKPIRDRKAHVEREKLSLDDWRKDFMKRYRKDVLGKA